MTNDQFSMSNKFLMTNSQLRIKNYFFWAGMFVNWILIIGELRFISYAN